MLSIPAAQPSHELALSIVARRRAPRVYVVDASGEVVLQGLDSAPLPPAVRRTAVDLLADAGDDEVIVGLSGDDRLVRLVRLSGDAGAHYALFVEPLASRSPVAAAEQRYALSAREAEILEHVLRGASTSAIAESLIIAESTVATHVRNIGAKMNASKRKEIVAAVLCAR
jgi:DNA-binding CsgD family transcriptional regulator